MFRLKKRLQEVDDWKYFLLKTDLIYVLGLMLQEPLVRSKRAIDSFNIPNVPKPRKVVNKKRGVFTGDKPTKTAK